MEKQALIESIAYCGLVCGKCHLKEECDGCKNGARQCARAKTCFQRNCCRARGLEGCWACDDFPCDQDMFSPSHDPKIRAFAAFVKARGAEALVDCILKNEEHGIRYGHKKDYDGRGSEEAVIRLLSTGIAS